MSSTRIRKLAPRRHRLDDGEEESSTMADVEDDSVSEGSAFSGGDDEADAEISDISEDEDASSGAAKNKPIRITDSALTALPSATPQSFLPTSVTGDVQNDAKSWEIAGQVADFHVDGTPTNVSVAEGAPPNGPRDIPKAPQNETAAQRSRREHQEYIKERSSNPAFVPTRGGFFLHDDRTNSSTALLEKSAARGRGRPHNPSVPPAASKSMPASASDKPWIHDLHDKHENLTMIAQPRQPPRPVPSGPAAQLHRTKSSSPSPNREFSFSLVLGNIPVTISMPGLEKKTLLGVKRHHTLLPYHRPPLRRDKPVRVSVPDAQPRYIFPSQDRSFIFIPRALRPNQQYGNRGRGRSSFHGSRRTSVYGGSTYTPSVAMSRRSSFGGPVRDMRSPTVAVGPRPVDVDLSGPRPIVRMPLAAVPIQHPSGPALYDGSVTGAMSYGYHPTALPMHQPRPQKTVSVADIETPVRLSYKGPQQQQDQPFHQQVPPIPKATPGLVNGGAPGRGTPLSHIPESAVYATPFQPFPLMPAPMIYSTPYYPVPGDAMQYASPLPGMPIFPPFAPMPMTLSHPGVGLAQNGQQQNAMAHESNGMVFYPLHGPMQVDNRASQQQFAAGVSGVMALPPTMNPQAPYYYPPPAGGVFYPTQST